MSRRSPHHTFTRRRPQPTRLAQSRKLLFEELERRCVLSATTMASITGTVFNDLTGNGHDALDPGIAGVTVTLHRDADNNGTFGMGDTMVASRTTGATGTYRFDNLAAGTYFVEQTAFNNLRFRTGTNVQTLVITPSEALGIVSRNVDTFTTFQELDLNVGNPPVPRTNSSEVAATEAIGGYRDLKFDLSSSSPHRFGSIFSDTFGNFVFDTSAGARGQALLT